MGMRVAAFMIVTMSVTMPRRMTFFTKTQPVQHRAQHVLAPDNPADQR